MRIWRSSLYKSPLPEDFPPLGTILREQDMNCTIEQAIAEAPPVPGALIINDIFEVDHEVESPIEMGLLVRARLEERQQRELNMAMLYFWDAMHLERVNQGGVLSGTEPAPLNCDEVGYVLNQLKRHPNWRQQTVVVYASDMERVVLHPDGKVTFGDGPS